LTIGSSRFILTDQQLIKISQCYRHGSTLDCEENAITLKHDVTITRIHNRTSNI